MPQTYRNRRIKCIRDYNTRLVNNALFVIARLKFARETISTVKYRFFTTPHFPNLSRHNGASLILIKLFAIETKRIFPLSLLTAIRRVFPRRDEIFGSGPVVRSHRVQTHYGASRVVLFAREAFALKHYS